MTLECLSRTLASTRSTCATRIGNAKNVALGNILSVGLSCVRSAISAQQAVRTSLALRVLSVMRWYAAASRGSTTCAVCPAGTYTVGSGASYCSVCKAGTYKALEGPGTCSPCEGGTYSDAGNASCSLCHAGTFSTDGATRCLPCEAGTMSGEKARSCSSCDAGSYSTAYSKSCTSCPDGDSECCEVKQVHAVFGWRISKPR